MNNINPNWSLKNYYPPLDNLSNSNSISVAQILSPYTTFSLFGIAQSQILSFPIGSFHELSFVVTGTINLQIDDSSQSMTDMSYKLTYPQLNTQVITITVSSSSNVKGIKTN